MTTITNIKAASELEAANAGSYYFIAGAGGDLEEWVTGMGDLMESEGIGRPERWLSTTGAAVNGYALQGGHEVAEDDLFPLDLPCLLFPLDGLNIGRLAMFKVRAQDRWFDDVIANMRRV